MKPSVHILVDKDGEAQSRARARHGICHVAEFHSRETCFDEVIDAAGGVEDDEARQQTRW